MYVAGIANSATTMREALQRSLDVICETMQFPVGHALLIKDDEPELAKSAHIVYVKDRARFANLFAMSTRAIWPTDFGAPGEVLRSGKPLFTEYRPIRNSRSAIHERKLPMTPAYEVAFIFQFL